MTHIRHRILLLTLLLLISVPATLLGQLATGTWKSYPAFGSPDRLIDTPHLVYLATAGSLHSYDKDNDETRIYEAGVDISGRNIKDIYYNFEGRYLVVVYADANIDIIPDDGERINLPEIRDANVNSLKEINDVKFDDGRIYVATSFGLVVYDDTRFEVVESGIYNVEILGLAVTPSNLLLVSCPTGWPYYLLCAPKTERHHKLDRFIEKGRFSYRPNSIIPLDATGNADETNFAVKATDGKIYRLTYSDTKSSATISTTDLADVTDIFTPGGNGVYVVTADAIRHLSAPWTVDSTVGIPEPLRNHRLSTVAADTGSLWAADKKGLGNYKLDSDGGLTVMRDKYRPSDASTFSDISNIYPLNDNRGFIICNRGQSAHLAIGNGDFYDAIFTGNTVVDGIVTDIDVPGPVTHKAYASNNVSQKYGELIFAPTFVVEDPDDHTKFYVGTAFEGIYVVKDGVEIGKFDENSKIWKNSNWAWRVCSGKIDSEGNLVVGVYTENADESPLIVLPADKRRQDPKTITKDDWVALDLGGKIKRRDAFFHICRNLPIAVMTDAQNQNGFSAVYFGSSITDTSDDQSAVISTLTDQDGKMFSPDYILCFAEDSRGRIWAGTTQGIFEISNPAKIFSSDFTINRLKVPRNDGTNLADYLLSTEKVYSIVVDAADRKWIATAESGLYLVSENGDEILAHFNTDNSPLPTNCITSVYVDPNSNSVFVATLSGLYEYSSTASPSRPDYSDVVAYPNPVTPDYTGLVTIRGLMDSSLVKIMDAGMHLVYQTTAEGGMATWDCSTLNGARVKSGVYYVLASVSSETSSQGDVVAKILVVN